MDKYKDIIEVQRKAAICYVFVVPMSVVGLAYIGYLIGPLFAFAGGFLGIGVSMIITKIILK